MFFVALFILWSPQTKTALPAYLDRQLFSVADWLQSPKIDGSQYVRINVSAEEMQLFMRDPGSENILISLIHDINHSFFRSVALVLPEKLPVMRHAEKIWRLKSSREFL